MRNDLAAHALVALHVEDRGLLLSGCHRVVVVVGHALSHVTKATRADAREASNQIHTHAKEKNGHVKDQKDYLEHQQNHPDEVVIERNRYTLQIIHVKSELIGENS